jgi:leader peptidase (prepilin peptidase)/N-methyltransferase
MITLGEGAGVAPWVVALVGLAGAGLGWALGRVLGTGGYRIESDEAGPALPRAPWWPAPALGVLWAALAWRVGDTAAWAALPTFLLFAWLAVALVWIDLDVHRLPDGLVLPAYPALLALVACASLGAGDARRLLVAVVAMAAVWTLYFVLAFVSPSSLGFGDVKLSGLIGLVLGWLGPSAVVLGVLAGFVAGGVAAVVLLLARRAGLRSHIAFGPPMLVGALAAVFLEVQLLAA